MEGNFTCIDCQACLHGRMSRRIYLQKVGSNREQRYYIYWCCFNVYVSYRKYLILIIIIIIIIINLFIEGSLISAKALFCLRALFGATRIHFYTRMASLNRTRFSDLCRHFRRGKLWVQLCPKMKTFLLVPCRA